MTAMAGIAVAVASAARTVLLTDGNAAAVDDIRSVAIRAYASWPARAAQLPRLSPELAIVGRTVARGPYGFAATSRRIARGFVPRRLPLSSCAGTTPWRCRSQGSSTTPYVPIGALLRRAVRLSARGVSEVPHAR